MPAFGYTHLFNNILKNKNIKILNKNTIFVGRLADYKYYNMDQIVARALMIFEKIAKL